MKITVLVDNNTSAGNCLISEHGLSFYVEEGPLKLLFDCGSSDAFIKNAYNMQIDLADVTDIILSHGHSDHIGGFLRLQALYRKFSLSGIEFNEKKLIAHPDVFKPENGEIYRGENFKLTIEEVQKFFNLELTKGAKFLSPKLVYLGEIPIIYGKTQNDYTSDETALAYKSKDGLVIISGCSHSGVKNIIEHAKYITGEPRVNTIIGGLYLINKTEDYVNDLGEYLKSQEVERIYPCHCTDLEAKILLSKYVKVEDVCTGKKYTWE